MMIVGARLIISKYEKFMTLISGNTYEESD